MNKCSYCGTSYEEIAQTGFVGCKHCYSQIPELKKSVGFLCDGKVHRGKRAKGGNYGNF